MNRFLCLHGLFQNTRIIQKHFVPIVKKYNALDYYLDAPHTVIPHYKKLQKLKVIYKNEFDNYLSWTRYPTYMNENDMDTLKYIADYLNDNPSINGIVGFSQGAMIASIVNTDFFYEKYNIKNNIKNMILISAFRYNNCFMNEIYSTKIVCNNSLHIIGMNDPIISPNKSMDIYRLYNSKYAKLITHERGHTIPKYIFEKN